MHCRKPLLMGLLSGLLLVSPANASITLAGNFISIGDKTGDQLTNGMGIVLGFSNSADPGTPFSVEPSTTDFLGGTADTYEIARIDISNGFGTVNFNGNIPAGGAGGNRLGLLWVYRGDPPGNPDDVSVGDAAPSAGDNFGFVDLTEQDNAIRLPADGGILNINANNNFGAFAGALQGGGTIVPEPSSIGLILMGMMSVFLRRRR